MDARYMEGSPDPALVLPEYSLADQLVVEPNPQLAYDDEARYRRVVMTPQEVAIALSHIEVWKLIANSNLPCALVLEDDVYFHRGFARRLNEAWAALGESGVGTGAAWDLVYLSFKETTKPPEAARSAGPVRRPDVGLWQLSGYVLSRRGARRLLSLLPARGPIDLWLNLQFRKLDVFKTRRPLIDQRPGLSSTNSYSILPILAQVGVLTREDRLLFGDHRLPKPLFATGDSGSGLTALATALSILGYRCLSDVSELPAGERARLFGRKGQRVFTAYVNVGSLGPDELGRLATLYPEARFIFSTTEQSEAGPTHWHSESPSAIASGRILVLPSAEGDKWAHLSRFLGCDYPAHEYPRRQEQGQRTVAPGPHRIEAGRCPAKRLKFDSSPWIVPSRDWPGISIADSNGQGATSPRVQLAFEQGTLLGDDAWRFRDDTFPGNLALFKPHNVTRDGDAFASLTLRKEPTPVRSFTSAAIASRQRFLYGRFASELRPSNVPGLITGLFLHRNAPRQEIDIEFLGKDTTKLLANVYYNPGNDGSKVEFGYRGTPVLLDLGFDAADGFHRYEIEWEQQAIRWYVDGRLLHERVVWDPTPIPDLPLELNLNLWHSRSRELAGRLGANRLPARTELRAIHVSSD